MKTYKKIITAPFLQAVLAVGVISTLPVQAESLFIANASVHTISDAGVLTKANVLIKNSKIFAVGTDVVAESDSTVVDGTGKILTPGFINAYTQLGTIEIDQVEATVDNTTSEQSLGASFDIADVINTNSTLIPHNRSMGLTRAIVVPGVGHDVFGGQAVLLSLSEHPVILRDGVAQIAQYGTESMKANGNSRAATLQKLRNTLDDARDYAKNKEAFQRGERRAYGASFRDLEALQSVLDGKQVLFVSANRAVDIHTLLKIKNEYRLSMVIVGAAEGHMVAAELAAAKVPVILDVLSNTPGSFDALAARFDNAAILNKAGVKIAFQAMGASAGHNAYLVRQGAGNAVAHGLPYDVAIAGLTRVPSEMVGSGDSFGRIEKGFDADLVLWSGDPLEVTTFPEHVIIAGKDQDMTSRASRLRDRYKDQPQSSDRGFKR